MRISYSVLFDQSLEPLTWSPGQGEGTLRVYDEEAGEDEQGRGAVGEEVPRERC